MTFKLLLRFTCFDLGVQQIQDVHLDPVNPAQTLVGLMVKEFGQRSVEIAREVLADMTDLEVTSKGRSCEIFPLSFYDP